MVKWSPVTWKAIRIRATMVFRGLGFDLGNSDKGTGFSFLQLLLEESKLAGFKPLETEEEEEEDNDLGKSWVRRMLMQVWVELQRVDGTGVAGISQETSAEPSNTLSFAIPGLQCSRRSNISSVSVDTGLEASTRLPAWPCDLDSLKLFSVTLQA